MSKKNSNVCNAFEAFFGTAAYQLEHDFKSFGSVESYFCSLEVEHDQHEVRPPKFLDITEFENPSNESSVKITHTNKGLFNLTVKYGLLTFIFPHTVIKIEGNESVKEKPPILHIGSNYDQGGSYVDITFLGNSIELGMLFNPPVRRLNTYTYVVSGFWQSFYKGYSIESNTILLSLDMYKDLIKQSSVKHTL